MEKIVYVSIEGWLMPKESYVFRMLKSIGIDALPHQWHQKPKRIPGFKYYIFAHSLAVPNAFAFAEEGDVVFAFDGRHASVASYFDVVFPFQKPFQAPKGVKVYNFYRQGVLGMPGYPVVGGENTKLPWTVSHPGVPKAAASAVKKIIEGVK